MEPTYERGGVRLYLGDCRDVLPHLTGVDAVVSDPPYGMAWDTDSTRFSGGSEPERRYGITRPPIHGDNEPFDPAPWLAFPRVVLFGFHHFATRLPVGTVLVWIKRNDAAFGTFLSDAELAWMKGGHGVYCFRAPHQQPDRDHASQKPVALMAWCIDRAKVPEGGLVVDPYMGSGTTGVRSGRRFVGVEIDPGHLETARRRIDAELRQGSLFEGVTP